MKTFSQFLAESLDSPYPYGLQNKGRRIIAVADTAHGKLRVEGSPVNLGTHTMWSILFDVDHRSTMLNVNDRSHSLRTLATVKDFMISHVKPTLKSGDVIEFAADTDERSRVKLYDRLVPVIANSVRGTTESSSEREMGTLYKTYMIKVK